MTSTKGIVVRQNLFVSRRRLVALVAGAFAITAGTAADPISALLQSAEAVTDSKTLLAASQQRVLVELRNVRRAHGALRRTKAFAAFAAALRSHNLVESATLGSLAATSAPRMRSHAVTALYRQDKPDAVLANVITRELETESLDGAAWMTRFAELEAVIHTRLGTNLVLVA